MHTINTKFKLNKNTMKRKYPLFQISGILSMYNFVCINMYYIKTLFYTFWIIHTDRKLFSYKKNKLYNLWQRGHYAKCNKSESIGQILYDLTSYVWNLKQKLWTHIYREETDGGRGWRWSKVQTSCYKISKYWGCRVHPNNYS